MCRTCRYIDRLHWPSFVFIGPPLSATRPVAAGRRLARPPLQAIRDLDRAPPPLPQALGRHPPPPAPGRPPSDRPPPPPQRPAGPSQPVRGGGSPGHPRHGISSAKNESADFGGLKNRPPKIDASSIFCTKRCAVYFWQVLKKSRRSNKYFERCSQKHEGRAESAPLSSARVKVW